MSQVESKQAQKPAGEQEADRHGLSREIPGPLGALVATIIVLVSIALILWSLVVTWIGRPQDTLPLFQVIIAGLVVSAAAVYAHKTFSYVVALIGGIAWVWVSVVPFVPILQVALQAVTVMVMIVGVNIAIVAVQETKKPRF